MSSKVEVTLKDFDNGKPSSYHYEELMKEVNFNLLPLLVNHKNRYVKWASAKRLASKRFSLGAFIYSSTKGKT